MSPAVIASLTVVAGAAAAIAPNLPSPENIIVGAVAAALTGALGYLGHQAHAQLRAMRGGK